MCFSAPVSFVSSAALAASAVKMGKEKTSVKKGRVFLVLIPFLFAIQQLLEGFQWIVPRGSVWSYILGYGFLSFAFVVWPILIPYVASLLEKDKVRRRVMQLFIGIGSFVSVYLLVMMSVNELAIELVSRHVVYLIDFPFGIPVSLVYILAVCGSLVLSTDKYIRYFGLAIWASAAITWVVFEAAFISVWCLFSALLTGLIYFYYAKTS